MQFLKKNNPFLFLLNSSSTKIIKFCVDLFALILSYRLSKYILQIPVETHFYGDLIVLFSSFALISRVFGLYHHLWRYTSLHDTLHVCGNCMVITVLFAVWSHFLGYGIERSFKLYLLMGLFSCAVMNFSRIVARMFFERVPHSSQTTSFNTILIGAGKGGELFIRESKKRQESSHRVEVILDDDPSLWGRKLFGVKVYGPISDLPKLASSNEIEAVVVAIPSLPKERLAEITSLSKELGLMVKVLPSFDNLLLDKKLSIEDISIDALLGRESVNLDIEEVSNFIRNKTVLVTGAGGSIGSEICRQLVKLNPKKILVLDHSEYSLYKISWELENTFKYTDFVSILANVTDLEVMTDVFEAHKPNIIFHAAAYKHVPLLESQSKQAVANNFLGTKNVAELASAYGSDKFILVSTDKAVNPTNVMGSTKRLAEIFCQNFNAQSQTSYVTVRFGNVLGSAGSVVPLFKKQLKQGGPLTVTHPDVTRFFMSIPEASQLVLQAGAMGTGGEIFVLDMGESIKISDLAERLIHLSGKRPYKDVDIVFTGLRPGEKLYEELFYQNEEHISTKRKKIFLANHRSVDFKTFLKKTKSLEKSLKKITEKEVVEIISDMVPEAKITTYADRVG